MTTEWQAPRENFIPLYPGFCITRKIKPKYLKNDLVPGTAISSFSSGTKPSLLTHNFIIGLSNSFVSSKDPNEEVNINIYCGGVFLINKELVKIDEFTKRCCVGDYLVPNVSSEKTIFNILPRREKDNNANYPVIIDVDYDEGKESQFLEISFSNAI